MGFYSTRKKSAGLSYKNSLKGVLFIFFTYYGFGFNIFSSFNIPLVF